MDLLDLSDFFRTKAEAADFNARISTVSEHVYQTDFDLSKELTEQFGITKKDKLITLMRDNEVNTTSTSSLKEFFGTIREKISAMPVLSLTLAFSPRESNLKAFSQWLLMNIKQQFLLELNIDTSLIGGAAITYGGKYLDFSVRQKVNEITNNILRIKTEIPVEDTRAIPSEQGVQLQKNL